jgi:lysylphosphatidylglycerol synthetase-like protein (DUF2156 family)/UDP-2,3-diacylglucosamine pyrophosphatase LpxH
VTVTEDAPSAPGPTVAGEDGNGSGVTTVEEPVAAPLVPDLAEIHVPRGGRVLVVSDQHLSATPTEAAKAATGHLVEALAAWDGPGIVIIAGDGFEQLATPVAPLDQILDAHQAWTDALAAFAKGPARQVVVLPGNHDGQLAWDPELVDTVRRRLGASVLALAVDLVLDTGAGPQKVRVVHGNQDDPYNAFIDPRSPIDTPAGHHVVRQVLPEVELTAKPGGILEGLPWLNEPLAAGEMLGSRLLYRKLVGRLWWLTIPFLAAVVLRFLAFIPAVERLLQADAQRWLIGLGIALVTVAVIASLVALATMLRVSHALSETDLGHRSGTGAHNASPRESAARLIAEGYAGLVSGHTHEPELSVVGVGFYANSGCGVETVGPVPARFGFPRPFEAVRRSSRVELLANEVVEVRLVLAEVVERSPALLERLVTKRRPDRPTTPTVVGSLPSGATYPLQRHRLGTYVHRRRIRRWAAGLLIAAGLMNIVSAVIGPSERHLADIEDLIPLRLPRFAGVLSVLLGVALIGLSRSVRRGYRPAWAGVTLLLGLEAVLMVTKGHDWEEGVICGVLALWLLAEHKHFRVQPPGRSRWVIWGATFAVLAIGVAAALAALLDDPGQRHGRVFTGLALGVVVLLGWWAARPARRRATGAGDHEENLARGRALVEEYGGDTLDYFALRDDKELLFTGHGLVAYTVLDRTMLVSPDPICPPEEREDAWADAMDHADSNGWGIAVLAANATWLPVYHAAGLHDVYIGDEAIVDCQKFSLKGKSMKSLRGAYNRVSKAKYTVQVMDPLSVEGPLKDQLLSLMTETRQGEVERGFSMTLSRMFDPRDTGLLLAVCFDPDGKPVAFNQYIPAKAIGGYSLDVMRRTSDRDAPNGLTDFVIIETISWMAGRGYRGLGLNFATFRAVVSGEMEGGPWLKVQRKVLHHFSDTMQIESLWKFNEKYDPWWRPRYVITDTLLDDPRAALAIGRAEGEVEVPVIGRFFKPKGPDPAEPASGG